MSTWIFGHNRILSDAQIARMADVTLTADILVAMIEGIKSKKQLKNYYDKYEKTFAENIEVSRPIQEDNGRHSKNLPVKPADERVSSCPSLLFIVYGASTPAVWTPIVGDTDDWGY